jgi:arylsulfatase A-like enzyme
MTNQPNLLLITIDCGRQDMIYGDEVETPNIDKLREKGITFSNAFCQVPLTLPSIYSIFSGQYMSTHEILNNSPSHYKSLDSGSLPLLLKNRGWIVKTFSGFDSLDDTLCKDIEARESGRIPPQTIRRKARRMKKRIKNKLPSIFSAFLERQIWNELRTVAENVVTKSIQWVEEIDGSRFFLWLHFFDAHMNYWASKRWISRYYSPPKKLPKKSVYDQLREGNIWFPEKAFGNILKQIKDIQYLPSVYKAAISYIDEQIGVFLDAMKECGLYDNTIIIVTSDHGENLLEHGMYCSHFKLFDTTTKVPLIVKDPELNLGKEVKSLCQHIDIFPTLLSRLNIDADVSSKVQGANLLPCISGEVREVHSFIYSEHMNAFQKTVRDKRWQYIWTDSDDVSWAGLKFEHDLLLKRNSKGTVNYANIYPDICLKFKEIATRISRIEVSFEENAEGISLESEEKLRSLGYLD